MAARIVRPLTQKFFLPNCHLWYRPVVIDEWTSSENKMRGMAGNTVIIDIGITKRGLDDIGDITKILPQCGPKGTLIKQGQELVKIEWDAHVITTADELYHAVWENVNGVFSISSAVDGILAAAIPASVTFIDDTDVMATIATSKESMARAIRQHSLVDETTYHRMISRQSPGQFQDE